MRIGDAAAAAGTTPRALRFYEENGLLSPLRRTSSGQREYGPRELDRLRHAITAVFSTVDLLITPTTPILPSTLQEAVNDPALGATGARLAEAVDSLDRATRWLLPRLDKAPEAALAGATPYLRLFAHAAGGCALAEEALAAIRAGAGDGADPAARIAIARFFADNVAVTAPGLERTVTEGADKPMKTREL